ncbi:hypothetical protein ACFX2I_006410 [Malus domestica]
MQQRFWSPYSSRVPEDQAFATVGGGAASQQQQQQPQLKHHHNSTPRASADELPVYDPRSGAGKKEDSSRSVEKWVHAIPVIVFFCLFVLWWFSVSVKVVSIDGRITSVVETEIPLLLNETRIDIAILAAVAMSPVATVPQNLTVNNATEVPSGGRN